MNILLINHYAGSPFHGMEYRPYHFAKEWIKCGHTVTIIASSFSHVRSVQPECRSSITSENIEGVQYVWLKTPEYHGNSVWRMINMLAFTAQLRISALPIKSPDIVIDSSTYPLTIYATNKIARKHGARLIFEVHDLWPLSPMELGGYSKWHPFIMVMQQAENYAYKNAYRVVSLLPNTKEYMISHGMLPEKFVYIPNGVYVSNEQSTKNLPDEHANILEELRRKGKFIVGYAGAHGLANALSHLIKAATMLKEHSRIHFLMIGQGPEKRALELLANKEELNNVSFLPPVPKTAVPRLLSLIDIAFIGWNRSPLYRFGISPNKLMDYMMAAKPVIHSTDAGNDLVAESGCGVSVRPEDPQAIADAVLHLFKISQEERDAMGRKGYDYVKNNHDYGVLARKFLSSL